MDESGAVQWGIIWCFGTDKAGIGSTGSSLRSGILRGRRGFFSENRPISPEFTRKTYSGNALLL
jgi:hypothetical protein